MERITDLLQNRASGRKFQSKPLPGPVLEDILEAGRLFPSDDHNHPRRFYVITKPDLIERISILAYRQGWMARAPVLIVLCTVFVEASKEGRDSQMQHFPEYASDMDCIDQELFQALNQEEHQTQIAGTRMVMAAREQGLETCWVSQFDVLALAMLLDLPMNMLPSEILAFGYPALFQWPFPKNIFGKILLTKV